MNNQIDFYFDIVSPFSFIAHKKIQKISQNKKIIFNYRPIFLGGLHKLAEIDAPAFNKFKIKILQSDCELVAEKNDISFIWNSRFPINSLYLMRGYLFVKKEIKKTYLDLFFNAYWKDNIDLSSETEIHKILNILDIDIKEFMEGINDESIKDQLKKLTNEAFKKELFGVPTFVANSRIFWGQDRLDYAVEEFSSI
ncbi:2-hydroxychromene-2-carboxylate isomerase [Candidatus Pelagibacter sp.]|nr:2-hydroxychromene-2-carboxylate isomerase [Candidatus Pelagibacter sp.]